MADTGTHSSRPAISAARKYTLAIIGLAALALQIGWMERERLTRLTLFAYFDKVLSVQELLTQGLSGKVDEGLALSQTSLGPDAAPIAILGAGSGNPMELLRRVMIEQTFSEVSLPGKTDELMTLTDPGGSCTVRVFRGNGPGRFLTTEYSSLNRFQRFSQVLWIPASKTYSVLFGRNCVFQLESNEPVVLYHHGNAAIWGVILPNELVRLGDFPGAHEAPQSRDNFLFFHGDQFEPKELSRFEGIDAPVARSYRIKTASAFIIESATSVAGKSFEPGQWREALGELVKSQAAAPTVFGISLPPQLAVVFMPLAMLLLSTTVLHRTRRILAPDPEEPWILLQPRGVIERFALALWVIALLASPAVLLWTGRIYDPAGFESALHNTEALLSSFEVVDPHTAVTLTRSDNLSILIHNPVTYTMLVSIMTQFLIVGSLLRILAVNGHPIHPYVAQFRLRIGEFWEKVQAYFLGLRHRYIRTKKNEAE